MDPEHSVPPAAGPDLASPVPAVPGPAVDPRGLRGLLVEAEKVLFYILLMGGLGAPLGAWLWVTVRDLLR